MLIIEWVDGVYKEEVCRASSFLVRVRIRRWRMTSGTGRREMEGGFWVLILNMMGFGIR